MSEMKRYITPLIKNGYIAGDGEPLKCLFCDSEELETYEYHENVITVVEKLVYCKQCNEKVGHWNYGSWSL